MQPVLHNLCVLETTATAVHSTKSQNLLVLVRMRKHQIQYETAKLTQFSVAVAHDLSFCSVTNCHLV